MAAPSPHATGITTDEARRELVARLGMRRWPYGAVFLVALALGAGFILIRLQESPQWWAYNTGCGIAMVAGAGVFLWIVYVERRSKLVGELGPGLFGRK